MPTDKNDLINKNDIANEPTMVKIPAGPFIMGTSDKQIMTMMHQEDWALEWKEDDFFKIEQPQHSVTLPEYSIGQNPVTNAEYHAFVFDTGYKIPKYWIGFYYPDGEATHPVTGINKNDALAYCKWLSGKLGKEYRLPNEAEWEKASRGTEGRIYPWGDNFDPWRCNTLESAKHATTPVGSYTPSGDSVYGVKDMIGNVWEWTSSFLSPYPFIDHPEKQNSVDTKNCIVRGGAWYYTHKLARCAARENVPVDYVSPALGFRLAN